MDEGGYEEKAPEQEIVQRLDAQGFLDLVKTGIARTDTDDPREAGRMARNIDVDRPCTIAPAQPVALPEPESLDTARLPLESARNEA